VRFRSLLAASFGLLSSFLAAAAHAEEPVVSAAAPQPAQPPPADLPPPSARTNLIIAGAATTAVSYGLALGSSFLLSEDDLVGANKLRIPIAGPWLALSKTSCPASDPGCSKVPLVIGAILEIFDGVAQAGGLGVIGEGLFLTTSKGATAARKAEGPSVRAVPLNFDKGGVGLGMIGTF
jgi:hypothetical protein